jgi:tetratricopeptide (TPR) repeat protein
MAAGLVVIAVFAARQVERWFALRGHFSAGLQALNQRDFAGAAGRFQAALEIDPGWTEARLELARAYAGQYVPAGESQPNLDLAGRAIEEFQRVLQKDPGNHAAVEGIAALYEGQVNYDDARIWYTRLAALDPPSANAYASLSRTSWKQVSAAILDARAQEGLQPEDDGPLPDSGLRRTLLVRWSGDIDEGIQLASKAIAIEAEHEGAMRTMSNWHRVRADLADTAEGHRRAVQAADDWMHKALAIRRTRAERTPR